MEQTEALLVQLESSAGIATDIGFLFNSNGKNWFEFNDAYWTMPNRPILGQTFEEHSKNWKPSANVALPHWFSHLLPEGPIRNLVASAAGTRLSNEFSLLARIGIDDLPGALRIAPADELRYAKRPPELLESMEDGNDSNPLLKFSLAGTQLKYSVFRDGRGLTIPVQGIAGNAIAKLPDSRTGFLNVPNTEFACLGLARESGIVVPNVTLVSIEEIGGLERWAHEFSEPALVIDRFDRTRQGRVHMEELAQVMNLPSAVEDAKYNRANFETVANLIGALCGVEVVKDVVWRIMLNVMVGNGDAHLKNWAITYGSDNRASLSPLYDVVPTVLFIPGDDMGLRLNGSRKFESVGVSSFDRIGERTGYGVDNARMAAKEAFQAIRDHWSHLNDSLPSEYYRRLSERLESLPLLGFRRRL